MFERFTDRARRVIVLAQEEARDLNHDYLGTEHLLLGMIHENEGIAFRVLAAAGVTLEHAQTAVKNYAGRGNYAPAGHIPFTPRAKKMLDLSFREAVQLGHNYISTEHLLLGLIRLGEGSAHQVLNRMGVDPEVLRAGVYNELTKGVQAKANEPPTREELEAENAELKERLILAERDKAAADMRCAEYQVKLRRINGGLRGLGEALRRIELP